MSAQGAVGAPRLVGVTVGDRPAAWRDLGFAVDDDRLTVGGVTVVFVGDTGRRGVLTWSLAPPPPGDLDGLAHAAAPDPAEPVDHPNGVTALDHLVVATGDLDTTLASLATADLLPRRIVDGLRGGERRYAFVVLRTALLEVIGPRRVDPEAPFRPARFAGLAFVADDLAPVAALPGVAGTPTDAVQPGRRIVTLRTTEHDVSVPIAVLTPRPERTRRVD